MVAGPLNSLIGMVEDGRLRPLPGREYPLEQARAAHEDLRSRSTTGKSVLVMRD